MNVTKNIQEVEKYQVQIQVHAHVGSHSNVKPVTNVHPLGPEKAVFSGRWSLARGLHRKTINYMNVRPSVSGEVVCSTRLLASYGGLQLQVSLYLYWTG